MFAGQMGLLGSAVEVGYLSGGVGRGDREGCPIHEPLQFEFLAFKPAFSPFILGLNFTDRVK